MTLNKSFASRSTQVKKSEQIPRVNLPTMFRLGLFMMGQGIMFILTLGVLNRIMIQELGIPATIVAAILAIPLFTSPTRVLFGQISDAKPIFGYHRTAYVWIGKAILAVTLLIALQIIWQLGNVVQAAGGWSWTPQIFGWTGLLALVFAVYGTGLSAASTCFTALLVDVSEEDNRSKLVGIVWSMLMVGVILGAILSSKLLEQLTTDASIETLQATVNRLFIILPAIVFGLAVLATIGVERKYSQYSSRSTIVNREDSITLGKALKILTASRQTGLFFAILVLVTISMFMQDPVIEPYAGQVFGMPLAESTKLNAFSGIGTLIGISTTGFLIVPRLGKRRATQLGCLLIGICAGLLGLAGLTANPGLLKGTLFLFGLASGVTTTGSISLVLDLTVAETAGTYIGAWGLGQAMARGFAVVSGGAVLDLGRSIFATSVLAYGLVFAIQALLMVLAVWLLNRLDVAKFRTNTKVAIASVLEADLD